MPITLRLATSLSLVTLFSIQMALVHATGKRDYRCKCICPHGRQETMHQTVFIRQLDNPAECKCDYVVTNVTAETCFRCQCRVEARNAILIQVIIFFIIISCSCLAFGVCAHWMWSATEKFRTQQPAPFSISADNYMRRHSQESTFDRETFPSYQSVTIETVKSELQQRRSEQRFVGTERLPFVKRLQDEIRHQRKNVYQRQNILS